MNANNSEINNNINRYNNNDSNNIDVIINNNNINATSNSNDITTTTDNVGLRHRYNNTPPVLTTNAAPLESSLLVSHTFHLLYYQFLTIFITISNTNLNNR